MTKLYEANQTEATLPKVVVVDDVEVRVSMHRSRTSAVASFADREGREQRVSLVARLGGGAMATRVPKRYEKTVQILGTRLWPQPPGRRNSS